MWLISESEISVPMDISAAAFTVASRSSGRIEAKSVVAAFVLKPIALITLAYARLSTMIFASSGKCQPYHSCGECVNLKKAKRRDEWYLHPHRVDVDLLVEVV